MKIKIKILTLRISYLPPSDIRHIVPIVVVVEIGGGVEGLGGEAHVGAGRTHILPEGGVGIVLLQDAAG